MKTLAQRRQKAVHLTKGAGRLLKASMKFVQQRWADSGRDKHLPSSTHVYEIRPRADKRGVDLIFDALPRREVARDCLVALFAGWCFCRLMKLTTSFSKKFGCRRATRLWRDVVVRILGFT